MDPSKQSHPTKPINHSERLSEFERQLRGCQPREARVDWAELESAAPPMELKREVECCEAKAALTVPAAHAVSRKQLWLAVAAAWLFGVVMGSASMLYSQPTQPSVAQGDQSNANLQPAAHQSAADQRLDLSNAMAEQPATSQPASLNTPAAPTAPAASQPSQWLVNSSQLPSALDYSQIGIDAPLSVSSLKLPAQSRRLTSVVSTNNYAKTNAENDSSSGYRTAPPSPTNRLRLQEQLEDLLPVH